MYLLGKRANEITADDIIRLVQNKVQENKALDYKRELVFVKDNEKKEFLFDITAMANTDGGCLIYGIEEGKDEKGRNTGIPEKITGIEIDNLDKFTQRIEDTIKGNTDPNISVIAINPVLVSDKIVLIIGISKTLGLPIMVTFNETNKFYRRRNSGKYPLDTYELNNMFMQNQVIKETAEKFRMSRIEKVKLGKVFPNIELSTSFFIHLIPFSFQNEKFLDLSDSCRFEITNLMRPMYISGYDTMFNVDGFATWSGMRIPKVTAFDQLHRNGIYEVYTSNLFENYNLNGEMQLRMYGQTFIDDIVAKVKDALSVLKIFEVDPPYIIAISMIGMLNGVIVLNHVWSRPFLVNEIYLPPIILATSEPDLYTELKPLFDIIWQSVSESQSPIRIPSK